MVCSKCGQELDEGVKFCPKCDIKFNERDMKIKANLTVRIIRETFPDVFAVMF